MIIIKDNIWCINKETINGLLLSNIHVYYVSRFFSNSINYKLPNDTNEWTKGCLQLIQKFPPLFSKGFVVEHL